MLGLLRRSMSRNMLKGAYGYMLLGQKETDDVRNWLAQAIVRTTLGSRDMWDSPNAQLAEVLSQYERKLSFVVEAAADMAHGHMGSCHQARRSGNKAAMYGFGVVANWLMAVGKGETALANQHREFICAVLDNYADLLSTQSVRDFGHAHGLP